MESKRFTLDTTLTLIAAYLGLFVGLIDANAINLALPAIRAESVLVRAVGQACAVRALTVTDDGRTALARSFGIDWSA